MATVGETLLGPGNRVINLAGTWQQWEKSCWDLATVGEILLGPGNSGRNLAGTWQQGDNERDKERERG